MTQTALSHRSRHDALVFVCFFVSGFAALIYQTAWTRQFAFVFGTSELAIATVLAAYMGGLAAGAAIAARFAPQVRRPVLTYALLELGIAAAALAVPFGISVARGLYQALFATSGGPPAVGGLGTALFYLACSFVILLIPTGLMGATLPLLTRHAVKSSREIGSRTGALYAINTAGAVAGTLLTGFLILPELGLRGTLAVAIASNALVFAAAALLARNSPPVERFGREETQSPPTGRRRFILVLILLSGSVSFYYEVLWSRLLVHILGGSLYAFSTMLGTFLLGIALGSAYAARRAKDVASSVRGFAWAQIATAALSWAAFSLLDRMPAWFDAVGDSMGPGLLADAAICGLILLPGTLCIGATIPYAIRIYAKDLAAAPTASARVYSWNTLGAVIGAIGAGFFLIPALGYPLSLSWAVAANLLLAAVAATIFSETSRPIAALALVGVIAIGLLPPKPPWLLLSNMPHLFRSTTGRISDFRVGRSATVMVRDSRASWMLTNNGLPEALILPPGSHPGTMPIVQWLGASGVLVRPEAQSALIIGLGGGSLLESLPESLEQIDVIEIEPEVVAVNRALGERRRIDPLADPRVRVTVNDARSALALTDQRYDLVVSQPSHPWTVASSNLYTREFFEEIKAHLSDDGVFVQWIGFGFVDAFLVKTLVATLLDAFPHVGVYQPTGGALLMFASDQPLELETHAPLAIAREPELFATLGLFAPEDLGAVLTLDATTARRFAADAPINRDDRNFLQTRSPKLLHDADAGSNKREEIFAAFEPLHELPGDWNALYLVRKTGALGFPDRALRLAETIRDPATRRIGRGLAYYARGNWAKAVPLLEQGLAQDPDSDEARIALIRLREGTRRVFGDRVIPGLTVDVETLREGLRSPGARAVAAGWRTENEGDWKGLEQLDPVLASVGPLDPGFADASRLRAVWRVESGEPQRAEEALTLIDTMGPLVGGPDLMLTRARAAAQAGHTRGALHTLFRMGNGLRDIKIHKQLANEALVLLDSLPTPPEVANQAARARILLSRYSD